MKTFVTALAFLFAVSVMQAQAPAPATPGKSVDTKATPAKPGAKAKKGGKEEEVPVIPGTNIARPNGTWLGLEVVGGRFKLSFYDAEKKPMAVDVTRATARWPNKHSGTPTDYRTVLNPSGTALIGARPVRPPYVFNVYLTLLQGEGNEAKAVENYTVQFRG